MSILDNDIKIPINANSLKELGFVYANTWRDYSWSTQNIPDKWTQCLRGSKNGRIMLFEIRIIQDDNDSDIYHLKVKNVPGWGYSKLSSSKLQRFNIQISSMDELVDAIHDLKRYLKAHQIYIKYNELIRRN